MDNFVIRFGIGMRDKWSLWSLKQRIFFSSIIVVVTAVIIISLSITTKSGRVLLFSSPITDETVYSNILFKLDEVSIKATGTTAGMIYVQNEPIARRARAILFRENLVPDTLDPWSIFDTERWTQTEFDNDVDLRRVLTRNLQQHIEALDDVDQARVTLDLPKKELFSEDQTPKTVSIVVTAKPGSDFNESRAKIKGLQSMVVSAITGLLPENVTIISNEGLILNKFDTTAQRGLDRLGLAERMIQQKKDLEAKYLQKIFASLERVFPDRVEIVNMDIDLTFDEDKVEEQEITPIELTPDNPTTPYSEREVIKNVAIGEYGLSENYTGTGFSPEGPAGQEGQVPPQYKDLQNVNGKYAREEATTNYEINRKNTTSSKNPFQINKVSMAVVLDGVWAKEKDANGLFIVENGAIKREYKEVSPENLAEVRSLIESAIGFDLIRKDQVTVSNIPFDRSLQFLAEDTEYLKLLARRRLILLISSLFVGSIAILTVVRAILLERERRRRLREEELARQQALARESALRNINTDLAYEMGSYESKTDELVDQASAFVREDAEGAANLVRTWLKDDSSPEDS